MREASGAPVPGASLHSQGSEAVADTSGQYDLALNSGTQRVEVRVGQRLAFHVVLELTGDRQFDVTLSAGNSISVRAEQDVLTPDPAMQGYTRAQLLDAHPGRAGVPVSVPGYPAETAEPTAFERPVGVPLRSYGSVALRYVFPR